MLALACAMTAPRPRPAGRAVYRRRARFAAFLTALRTGFLRLAILLLAVAATRAIDFFALAARRAGRRAATLRRAMATACWTVSAGWAIAPIAVETASVTEPATAPTMLRFFLRAMSCSSLSVSR